MRLLQTIIGKTPAEECTEDGLFDKLGEYIPWLCPATFVHNSCTANLHKTNHNRSTTEQRRGATIRVKFPVSRISQQLHTVGGTPSSQLFLVRGDSSTKVKSHSPVNTVARLASRLQKEWELFTGQLGLAAVVGSGGRPPGFPPWASPDSEEAFALFAEHLPLLVKASDLEDAARLVQWSELLEYGVEAMIHSDAAKACRDPLYWIYSFSSSPYRVALQNSTTMASALVQLWTETARRHRRKWYATSG